MAIRYGLWIDEKPTLDDISKVYGSCSVLPTTVIVRPLKTDKVKPVKQQLSSVEPEVLLFVSKIKSLSIREDNEDTRLNTVSGIAITSETNFMTRNNLDAESYTLHLSAKKRFTSSETNAPTIFGSRSFLLGQKTKWKGEWMWRNS